MSPPANNLVRVPSSALIMISSIQYHVALLGDSIFDNAAYVAGEQAMIDHLRKILPSDWHASLIARDGDSTADVAEQLGNVPAEATHLIVSVGGNDALAALSVFSLPVGTVEDALYQLAEVRKSFQCDYRAMLWQVLDLRRPVAVCTIYDAVPGLRECSRTALSIFNDTIVREAETAGVPVIDLRSVCTEAEDYSAISPIEPSSQGGRKIARRLVCYLTKQLPVTSPE